NAALLAAPEAGEGEMRVIAGRHPVIERLSERDAQRFIPNDLYFHPETQFIAVITDLSRPPRPLRLCGSQPPTDPTDTHSCFPLKRSAHGPSSRSMDRLLWARESDQFVVIE
ncbi:MAG: hypothetical protein ACLP1X_13530, partial [Polyangiaceae bacterium]